MNQYFIKKAVAAVAFILLLGTLSLWNLKENGSALWEEVKSAWKNGKNLSERIADTEQVMEENTVFRYSAVDVYGYMQLMMGKEEQNNFEVIKDQNGFLHYTYFGTDAKDVSDLADRLQEYKEKVAGTNAEVIYVMTPDKVLPGYTVFSEGLPYNYANETADGFLKDLSKRDIAYIDLREGIRNAGIADSDLFYRTDHHWTTQAAFLGFRKLLEELEKRYDLPIENMEYYTNLDHYEQVTYKERFIGSMGRKTGVLYSGRDDFTVITPKFDTDYTYQMDNGETSFEINGGFQKALLSPDPFEHEGGKYDVKADLYASYLYGNQAYAHIENHMVKNGLKVLFIKDSFVLPMASFLSTVCSDIYLVDPRYYDSDITELTNSLPALDYIFVSFNPQSLTEEFFSFGG
ncbi:MAG: hypothetical protein E7256_00985 [Lachnospiraceae bacterium]|nr:hypothetical protein [Lachnospiraceae bacterium]